MTTVNRVFNFSAGPAVLPLPVLEQIQAEMVALPGVGMSILEVSQSPDVTRLPSRAARGCAEHRSRTPVRREAQARDPAAQQARQHRWRRGVGVEPTQQRMAPPTGFEARPTHQDRFLSMFL